MRHVGPVWSAADSERLERLLGPARRLVATVARADHAPLVTNWLTAARRSEVGGHVVFTRDDTLYETLGRQGMPVIRLQGASVSVAPGATYDPFRVTHALLEMGVEVLMTEPGVTLC